MKRNKKTLLLSLLAVAILLSGCTLFSAKNGRLVGKVTMGDGETPIKAEVYVGDKKVTTADDKGMFSLVLKPGKYNIQARYLGKNSVILSVEIKNGAINEIKNPVKVTGLGILNGTVKTSDDKLLVGAKVSLGAISVTADKDGKYDMIVAPGEQTLKVEYKGYTFSESYTMPEKIVEKNLQLADLAQRSLTLKNAKGEAHAALDTKVDIGTFTDSVKTNAEGLLTLIAPAAEADVTVKLPLPHTTADISVTKNATLGTATDLAIDIKDNLLFSDDFKTSNPANYVFANAEISGGKLKHGGAAGRGLAWLKSDKIGASDNYIAIVKTLAGGATFRVNAAVPDDRDSSENINNVIFYGYQNSITTGQCQFSSFHGSNGPGGAPYWGWKRDLDFNYKAFNQEKSDTHPIIELLDDKQVAGQETIYAIKLEKVTSGRDVTIWFNGAKRFTILDSDSKDYDYPTIGTQCFYHQGGGVALVFDAPANGNDSYYTSIEIYKL